MLLNGSEILIECLKEQGVDTVFGYPGGTILNVYDALYHHQDEIRHILTSHEQGAAHAADGYARATGKTGVVFATSGPGATNLVTGIATAYMDSIPVVAFTCNVGVSLLGKDSFQEVDIAGITMPITKYSAIVRDIKDLAPMIRRAFRIAKSGRPGPVLLDITKDVTAAKYEFTHEVPEPILPKTDTIREEDLDQAAEMIRHADRPIIFVGGGAIAAGASEELREFAHTIDAPVCDTLMGKGAFPGTDPLYMGMLGMHGTKTANRAVSHCDLLIAAGTRFADRDTGKTSQFAHQAKILHLDVDAAEINKNVIVDASVVGDLRLSTPHGAVCRGRALSSDPGKRHHHQGCGAAPDVGGPVLFVYESAHVPVLRRPRHHGLRLWCGDGRKGRMSGQDRHQHRRRRLLPHEHE